MGKPGRKLSDCLSHGFHEPERGFGMHPNVLEVQLGIPIQSRAGRYTLRMLGVGQVPNEDDAHFLFVREHRPLLRHELVYVRCGAVDSVWTVRHFQDLQTDGLSQAVEGCLSGQIFIVE